MVVINPIATFLSEPTFVPALPVRRADPFPGALVTSSDQFSLNFRG